MRNPLKTPLHSKDCTSINLCEKCLSVNNWFGLIKVYGVKEAVKIRDSIIAQKKQEEKKQQIPIPRLKIPYF